MITIYVRVAVDTDDTQAADSTLSSALRKAGIDIDSYVYELQDELPQDTQRNLDKAIERVIAEFS